MMLKNRSSRVRMQSLLIAACVASALGLGCGSDASGGGAVAGGGGNAAAGAGGSAPVGGSGGTSTNAGAAGSLASGGGGAGNAGSGGSSAGAAGNAGASSVGGSAGAGAAGASGNGGAGGATSAAFELKSSAFANNGMIPDVNSCAGADTSPELSWGAGTHTPLAYAIVLRDTTNGFTHWVLWDIPASTTELAADLATQAMLSTPSGAKQVAFSGTGYKGPCPSGQKHVYEFSLHAMKVATLPGVTTSSTPDQVKKAVENNSDAATTLLGTSSATKP